MSEKNYRSKLSALEKEIYEQHPNMWNYIEISKDYIIITTVWLILLVSFTPSFLYTPKKKHQPQSRLWGYLILLWITLSIASSGGYYYYQTNSKKLF